MARRKYANRDHPRYPEYWSRMLKLNDEYRKKHEGARERNENTDAIVREHNRRIKELRQEYSFLWDE